MSATSDAGGAARRQPRKSAARAVLAPTTKSGDALSSSASLRKALALVANLDYSDYLGRLAIGRVFQGTLRHGDEVAICHLNGTIQKTKITKLYSFEGLKRVDETIGYPGDVLAIAGVEGITIGETVTSVENPQP